MTQVSPQGRQQTQGAFSDLRSRVLASFGIDPFPAATVAGVPAAQPIGSERYMSMVANKRQVRPTQKGVGIEKSQAQSARRHHLLRNRTYELWGQCTGCLDTFTVEAVGEARSDKSGRTDLARLKISAPRIQKRLLNGRVSLVHRPCDRTFRVFDVREYPVGFSLGTGGVSRPGIKKVWRTSI